MTQVSTNSADLGLGHRIVDALKGVRWYFMELMGDNDYQKYVDHLKTHHPDAEVPTEQQFWKARWDEQQANPGSRCC